MKKLRKEEIAEDYCFVCKDGGDLLICDYGDCLKCYHPECEGKEESILDSKERWTCRWHQCSLCNRPSKFQCFTCPTAVCGQDLYYSEFAQVRGHKGFCAQCLLLASAIEKNMDVVSDDGVKVDFDEEATYEQYFKQYYEIVKEKEGLTAQMALSAMAEFRKGKQIWVDADSEDVYHSEDGGLVSDYDDIGDEEQKASPARGAKKKRKRLSGRTRKSNKSNTSKFIGWGSESLIAFLNSIGKETTESLSLCDVDTIIRKYIHSNKLVTKKMVSCDEKLQSLFRRKAMKIHRISGLLESHFAEKVEHLDQEDIINATSSEGEDHNSMQLCQREKKIISKKVSSESETPSQKKSCYAAVVAENIKSIYMRRNLVEKLLKGEPETAKDKLVGSFVRIKSDPYDCMQRNSFQLVKVTGVNEASLSGQTIFLLQVSNRDKSIPVFDISEEDITSEECDDLRQRVNAGLLNRITVVDLGQKARMLHEDITKHWITRRLAILQNLIDRANEKGWRRELHEYLEAKDLLQTEAEQSRLLLEVPTIIADEIIDLPCTTLEGTEKSESELPQNINSKSSSSPNDPDSSGAKSSNLLEVNKLQLEEGSSKKLQDFNYPMGLPTVSMVNTSLMLGLRAISGSAFADTSSLTAESISPVLGLRNSEPSVEDTSSPSAQVGLLMQLQEFDYPMGLPTPSMVNTSLVLGLRAISGPAFEDTSSLTTGSISPVWGLRNSEPSVEDTSSPSARVCQMTNTFLNCLRLDFPTLFKSNNQSSFLQSLTFLSKVGDFSLKQIDAMENLVYEFPRLTSDYEFAEKTTSKFERIKQLHSSLLEDVKQYTKERQKVEDQEKSAHESSLKIQEEIRKLQLKLKAINSEKKTSFSRMLALDSKVKDTKAKLAISSLELDTWEIRQRKAVKEREIVHAVWESFKKQFTNISDTKMASELTSVEKVDAVKNKPSIIAASEALTKVKSEEGTEYIHTNSLDFGTTSFPAAHKTVQSLHTSSTHNQSMLQNSSLRNSLAFGATSYPAAHNTVQYSSHNQSLLQYSSFGKPYRHQLDLHIPTVDAAPKFFP